MKVGRTIEKQGTEKNERKVMKHNRRFLLSPFFCIKNLRRTIYLRFFLLYYYYYCIIKHTFPFYSLQYLCNAFIYLVNRNFTQRCCTKRCRCALECNKKMCYFLIEATIKYIIIERCVVSIEKRTKKNEGDIFE